MPVTIATNNDLKGIRAIWEEHFTTDSNYLTILFEEIIPLCTNYVYKEDNTVISTLSLMPMRFINGNDKMPSAGWYMFGVATLKDFWGKKLAASTILHAIKEMKAKGYQFIFERPANQSLNKYYLNLGFSHQLKYIPHTFNITCSTENITNNAEHIIKDIAKTFPKRFEWEKTDLLKGLIKLGEIEFNNIEYQKNPPQGTFIAINPIGEIKPEIFNDTFFCFPME